MTARRMGLRTRSCTWICRRACRPCWPAAARDWTPARGRSPAKRSGTNWQRTRARPVAALAGSSHFPAIKVRRECRVHPETKFAGRGVPDVAGDADPVTGYQVRVDGQNLIIGGTSAVAPLWAGLIAAINGQLGQAGWICACRVVPDRNSGIPRHCQRAITAGIRRPITGTRVPGWVVLTALRY